MPVLILFAHPAIGRSRVNRNLIAAVEDLPGVTVHDLYDNYPDFQIDVDREQELLRTHSAIIFHHPLYWYSSPSILKEWQDLVLTHRWAYGKGGDALAGKIAVQAITAGGGAGAYGRDGQNRFTVRELLAPFEQTCRLCGIDWLGAFAVFGSLELGGGDDAKTRAHAESYRELVESLRDGTLDIEAARGAANLNPTPA